MRFTTQTYQITIQNVTETRDASGGIVETWATYSQPYASVKYSSGSERLQNDRSQTQTKALFKVRHDSDTSGITEKMRISWDGIWDIESILSMGRDEVIEIMAVKHG